MGRERGCYLTSKPFYEHGDGDYTCTTLAQNSVIEAANHKLVFHLLNYWALSGTRKMSLIGLVHTSVTM